MKLLVCNNQWFGSVLQDLESLVTGNASTGHLRRRQEQDGSVRPRILIIEGTSTEISKRDMSTLACFPYRFAEDRGTSLGGLRT